MKRFHVHVNVADLDASLAFYARLFDASPAVVEADCAKWMLDDPRINFAISRRERAAGVDYLGLQVEDAEVDTTCCYAHSDKVWSEDPQGLCWEAFHTHGAATTCYDPTAKAACCGPHASANESKPFAAAAACCGPAAASTARCG